MVAPGVPSREARDELLESLPAYFEANQIHVAALVTASYAGEEFSHYLATSSLGTWLKEQGVPAIYGVDTRALTKRIRKQGSMLGKLLIQKPQVGKEVEEERPAAVTSLEIGDAPVGDWREDFESIEWIDPNKTNLVAEGNSSYSSSSCSGLWTKVNKCRYGNPGYSHHRRTLRSSGQTERLSAFCVWMSV